MSASRKRRLAVGNGEEVSPTAAPLDDGASRKAGAAAAAGGTDFLYGDSSAAAGAAAARCPAATVASSRCDDDDEVRAGASEFQEMVAGLVGKFQRSGSLLTKSREECKKLTCHLSDARDSLTETTRHFKIAVDAHQDLYILSMLLSHCERHKKWSALAKIHDDVTGILTRHQQELDPRKRQKVDVVIASTAAAAAGGDALK